MANNTLLASDSFTSGSLAAGWSAIPSLSKCQVVAGSPNVTQTNSAGTAAGQLWTGTVFPSDQTSEVTLGNLVNNINVAVGLAVRFSSSALNGYLAVVNGTGTLTVYVDVAGSVSQLGDQITGITWASGDVVSFQAAGSALTVYQNGTRIYYFYDTTYTSGFPGYDQNSNSANSDSQVQSWRGYSAVQQDGIWQKKGVVISPIAVDLSGSAGNGCGLQCFSIIYEGNAQLLSGNVYKAWLVSNWNGSVSSNMYYAESLDGISWIRKSSAIIVNFNGVVFKNGSTYYMYGQEAGSVGSGTMQVYTSSDGVNWVKQTPVSTISIGSAGQWDDFSFYNIGAVTIRNGVWYGYYNAAGATGPFSTGLATSTDGINWVKYPSNPIILNFTGAGNIINIGGTYYQWGITTQPGQGGSILDPFDSIRVSSADLVNWSFSAHSMHRSQMFESVNALTGGCIAAQLMNVGNQTYCWTDSSQGDASSPQIGQIGLAIAPAPLAKIVQYGEDATIQTAFDSFTSGLGNLSPNWTTLNSVQKLQIVSGNLVEASATSTVCGMYYFGASFSGSQYSEITIATLGSGQFIQPGVCYQPGSYSGYSVSIEGGTQTNAQFQRVVNGVVTSFGPISAITVSPGDVIRLAITPASDGFPVLSLYQNGFLILQYQDYNATFSSGYPAIVAYTTSLAQAQVSKWAAGNTNVIPNYSSGSVSTPGTIYGTYSGTSIITAFSNPYSLDLLQVVDEGGFVVWNLTASGTANFNPSSPTANALIGKFIGSSFSTAFPNPKGLDIIQIVGPGSGVVYRLDSSGISHIP